MRENNLLTGNIFKSLIKLSIPLMGTAFIQMAYSIVDLMWLGRLSTEAVAAVGCIGFFMWIAQAASLVSKSGISVLLSQAYGKGESVTSLKIIGRSGLEVNFIIYLLFLFLYSFFIDDILNFYNLNLEVFTLAREYFIIIIIGLIFVFLGPAISAFYYARGNSITPFKVSVIGLIFNLLVDPIFIFGFGPIEPFGVKGAAIATIMAQGLIVFIYLFIGLKNKELYIDFKFFKKPNIKLYIDILKIGLPMGVQSMIHALVGVKLSSIISSFGATAIATSSIGSQIESVSWMSAEGFATAFSAMYGQNYGAKNFKRIRKIRNVCYKILLVTSIICTSLLILGSKTIFTLFTPNDLTTISNGINYLKIIGLTQGFMIFEIGITGMLSGLGITKFPSIISMTFNILRIPMSILLISIFGLNGVWISISASMALKGIIMFIFYTLIEIRTKGFQKNM